MKKLLLLCALLTVNSLFAEAFNPSWENQVVLVTGASKGIGKGIARVFAQEGATVILSARNETDLANTCTELKEYGANVFYYPCDVSQRQDVDQLVAYVEQKHGSLDVVCHNAGIYPEARLENMSLSEWQHVIDTNLTGTFNVVQACIPTMKAQNRGKIVITSSISGPITGLPSLSHYTASKGGIEGFVKTASIELAKYNIQVNTVQPGNILTEGLMELGENYLSQMTRAIPAGKLGKPEDIGYAALFLASQGANFITGQSLVVDGGQVLPESHFGEY